MVSMALYGAALTAASGGAMVATERALGWSRQLRLTPLNPAVYIAMKALVALVLGAVAIAVVNVVGVLQGRAVDAGRTCGSRAPCSRWSARWCSRRSASSSATSCPGENAMQILGPGLALLSFLGNVFIPIDRGHQLLWHVAAWTPMFGVAEISRAPLTGELPWYAVRQRRRLARRSSSPAPRGG